MGEESFVLIVKRIGDLVQVVGALKKEKGVLAEELARKESGVRELGNAGMRLDVLGQGPGRRIL